MATVVSSQDLLAWNTGFCNLFSQTVVLLVAAGGMVSWDQTSSFVFLQLSEQHSPVPFYQQLHDARPLSVSASSFLVVSAVVSGAQVLRASFSIRLTLNSGSLSGLSAPPLQYSNGI